MPNAIQQQSDAAYERHVLKEAKRMALTHIMDVLAAAEAILRTVRHDMDPGHDGRVSGPGAILQAQAIVRDMLCKTPTSIIVRAIDCVTLCDSQNRLPEHAEKQLAGDVNEYVKDVLCQLMLQRGRYENDNNRSCC